MRAWVLCLFAVGCGAPSPCAVALAPDGAHDLVLAGSGACADRVALSLRVATGAPDSPQWTTSAAASSPVQVGGAWSLVAGGAARTLTLTNPGAQPISIVGIEWATDGGAPAADRMMHDGYQSWSYAGFESIGSAPPDVGGTAPNGGGDEDTLAELAGVSWWWIALSDEKGAGLVAGADGGTVLKTYLAADGGPRPRLRIVEGMTGDALQLAPGETRALDGIYVALGDVSTGLDAYAAYVAAHHPPEMARSSPRGGWGSWNLLYAMPTADLMQGEAAWASTTLAPLGLTDFLIDDGYEPHWGDWQAAPGFGVALDTLAGDETQAGLRPAIWMAPFYVEDDDPLVAQHPDWFVHRADGTLREYANNGKNFAALDVTSPGARDFAVAAVQQYRSWGYQTLKLDFLFGGAIEGVRQQPVTALESYQMWMRALREAVPDAHLIGCGAPMLPSVGWVDSMRTGPDIAFSTTPTPRYGFVAHEARQTAMRGVTDHFWALDPDVVLLRGTDLSDAEAWTAVVAAAMAGGNYLLGDGQEAGAVRQAMALAPDVIAIARDGAAARALDLAAQTDDRLYLSPLLDPSGGTAPPHLWQKTAGDGRRYLAAFAWDEPSYAAAVALPADTVELVPPSVPDDGSPPVSTVTEAPVGAIGTVEVSMHGVRLFRFAAPK